MLLTPDRSYEVKTRIQIAVEAALKARDISARRASLDVVGNDGLIRDIRAGRLPGVDRLEALFEYLGLEFYFGPPTDRTEAARMIGTAQDKAPAGFVAIPWHALVQRSAGGAVAPVALSRDWLHAAGLDPAALAAVRPDAAGGTVVLVDPSAKQKDGPSLWCYREGGRVRVGRVQFDVGMTIFLPDTREGRARVLQGDDRSKVSFLGRVMWSGELQNEG